ncbi:MAG: hypothetical protein IPP22_11335 [Nitrosomonas sp.]|nr:hypothetical protein [Nitrosomonas sp.]
MKTHAKQSIELDHLNLAPEAKVEVSNLIQLAIPRGLATGSIIVFVFLKSA